jgi:hypothetical protein
MQSKLIIKKISSSGALLEEITCLSGCVNVFRSTQPEKLESYEKALFDVSSASQFEIELDNVKINPIEGVACVGVGTFKARQGSNVKQILINAGYKGSAIDSLVATYELTSILDKKGEQLNEEELRKVELLVAAKQKSKILFVKDPFAPLSPSSRDTFAKLITASAVSDNKIVVVSRLSERPESWVGNVAIARIDLTLNRQATIGFDPRLIERIRSEVLEQAPQQKDNVVAFKKLSPRTRLSYHLIAGTCIVVVLGTLGSALGGAYWKKNTPETEVVSLPPPPPVPVAEVAPPVPQEEPEVVALSLYSPEIGQSIRSAFMEEDEIPTIVEDTPDAQPVTPEQKRDNTQDIFRAIQENDSPSDNNSAQPEYSSSDSSDNSDSGNNADSWEKTREEMRRRFLESISQGD